MCAAGYSTFLRVKRVAVAAAEVRTSIEIQQRIMIATVNVYDIIYIIYT